MTFLKLTGPCSKAIGVRICYRMEPNGADYCISACIARFSRGLEAFNIWRLVLCGGLV